MSKLIRVNFAAGCGPRRWHQGDGGMRRDIAALQRDLAVAINMVDRLLDNLEEEDSEV